ncbi:hypothetical protein AAD018_011520 [Aestuariibius insulae]|uniref:hypothetical protein n=1 Tax=Aestuariibius insulae TaxID=2058287 RepID=UPI00345EA84B
MARKTVGVRLIAENGQQIRAEFAGVGMAGKQAFEQIASGQKSAEASARVFEQALEDETQAFRQLRASVDPAFSATQRYQQVVRSTQQAVRAGAATQAQANQVLALAQKQYERAGRSATRFNRRFALRNVSLQLSQVAQTAQVLGNPLRALAIQIPDLAIGFGPLGIAIGAVIGAASSFALSMFQAKRGVEELEDSLPSLERRLGDLEQAEKAYADAALARQVIQTAVTNNALILAEKELSARRTLFELEFAREEIRTKRLRESVSQLQQELDDLVRVPVGLTEDISNEAFVNTQAEQERLALVEEALAANEDLVDQIRVQNAELDVSEASLEQMRLLLQDGAASADDIANSNMADGISQATVEAAKLANTLGIAVSAAFSLQRLRASQQIGGGRGRDPRDFLPGGSGTQYQNELGYESIDEVIERLTPKPTRSSSRSGRGARGGSSGRSEAERAALREQNQLEREAERVTRAVRTELEQYNAEREKLQELLDKNLISTETFNRAMETATEIYEEAQFEEVTKGVEGISRAIAENMDDWEGLRDGVAGVLEQIRNDILTSQIEDALMAILQPILGGLGGGQGFGASLLDFSAFGPSQGGTGELGLPSFDGGGHTGYGPRLGGLDGRGGYLAMVHPREHIEDETRPGGGRGGGSSETRVAVDVFVKDDGTLGAIARDAGAAAGAVAAQKAAGPAFNEHVARGGSDRALASRYGIRARAR